METVTEQDGKDKSKNKNVTDVKGFERRRTYLKVILNAQKDSESEQGLMSTCLLLTLGRMGQLLARE